MIANQFRPVNAAHAIVEQVVFFEFTPDLDRAMPALITLKDDLRDELPGSEIVNTLRVQVNAPSLGQPPELGSPELKEAAGIRLSRVQPDGSMDTVLSVDNNNIAIFCYKYTCWDEIWKRQKLFLQKAFSKVGNLAFMTGIGMKWTDQFIYEGDPAAYDARKLLNEHSDSINPRTFKSGTRWHCHTGWFDTAICKQREILNQLNLNAGPVNIQGNMRVAVTIDHTQILRASKAVDELAAYAPGTASGFAALCGLMDALHDGNKRTLRDLLTESSLQSIALGPEQVG